MTTIFNRLISALALSAGLMTTHASAQTSAKPASLSGTWTMSLIGDHVIPVGLALKQEGTSLTGTLTLMGKDIPLKGELTGSAFTLTGPATMMMHDPAQASGTTPQAPVPMKFSGTVLEDGTLAGEFTPGARSMKWTADRLKERPVAAVGNPSSGAPIVGSWNVSVIADHVTPVGLRIEPDGAKVKATLTIMGGDVPLSGDYTAGSLTLNGEFTDDVRSRTGMTGAIKVTAKMKDDGTIAGEFAMARGTFPLTGERFRDRAPKAPGSN
jgi:hypothetical protein